jgi:methylmalonyl-CoA mutase cobalamin-binding subunit
MSDGWDGAGPQRSPLGTDPDGVSDHEDRLVEIVETDLTPRLLAACGAVHTEPMNAIGDPKALDRFCRVLLSDRLTGAMKIDDDLSAKGVPMSVVYGGYVADAARRLGALRDDDAINFVEASVCLARLHSVVRRLSPTVAAGAEVRSDARSALFAVTPGEGHALGVVIAAEFFARAGWKVQVDPDPEPDARIRLVAKGGFDAAGLSISASRFVDRLKSTLDAVRLANSRALAVVGGSLLAGRPDLAEWLRPDFVAGDADSAMRAMTSILDSAGRSAT